MFNHRRATLQKLAAQKAEISEAELESQLINLVNLLPGVQYRIASMKVEQLLNLLSDRESVAERLLVLKLIFPSAGLQSLHSPV